MKYLTKTRFQSTFLFLNNNSPLISYLSFSKSLIAPYLFFYLDCMGPRKAKDVPFALVFVRPACLSGVHSSFYRLFVL
jgi:hypothetical protein